MSSAPPFSAISNATSNASSSAQPDASPDFHAIFEASPGSTLVLAPDAPRFTIVAASDAYLAATLTARAAILGRPVFEAFSGGNPATAERDGIANLRASLEAVLQTRAAHAMPAQRYDVQGPNGGWEERYWQPFNVPVLGPDGEVRCLLHRVEDVTARERAEAGARDAHERLVTALAASGTGTFRWDIRTDALEWDDNLSRLFSLPPGQRAQTLADFVARVHPDDRAVVQAACAQSATEGADFDVEFRVVRCDGRVAWLAGRGRTHCDAAGRLCYMTGACVEVTARKTTETVLREAKEAAEAANRTKSEFLATMSHEFRTPLNAILGYAQLLDMGVLGATTPSQHTHLERLQASARHLLHLVDDVLDVAKVDADRLAVRRDTLTTGAAVASALALVQPQATAKGIRIEDFGVPGPGLPYVGDEHRVRQILVNLLANAVKFTPPGGAITVDCGAAAEPGPGVRLGGAGAAAPPDPALGWAYVRVRDTGPGIAPELLGRLFEPFLQGDGALTRTHGGTGLGLAISRRLARLMGGDLVAANRPGSGGGSPTGASFTLWLPAPGAPRAAAPVTQQSGPDQPVAGQLGRRTPTGMAAVGASSGAPAGAGLSADAYAVLFALGTRLAADAETVAERYVAALRADPRFPGVATLPAVQLRDHTTPVVGLIATQIMVIGETRGAAPELLGDGAEVQRVMAELHGAQRFRLGWAESDVEREQPLLRSEVERALDGALGREGVAAVRGAPGSAPETVGREAVDWEAVNREVLEAASRYAADLVRHALDLMLRTALRSYRFAREAATP